MDMESREGATCSLNEMEIDAIGEILNISMGAAATAVSSMLDKQVLITTPKVSVRPVGKLDYSSLEPAMIVKITYVQGITGSNVMVFRQKDMQFFLNQLMGVDEPPRDDFIFDELGISAACEVMNQMMGASSTALSEFLGRSINISTPSAVIMDEENTFSSTVGLSVEENVVAVFFDLIVSDLMKSEFVSILTCDLAKMIVSQFMNGGEESAPVPQAPVPQALPPQPTPIPEPIRTYADPMSAMNPQAAIGTPPSPAAGGFAPPMNTAPAASAQNAAPPVGMNPPIGQPMNQPAGAAMGYNPQAPGYAAPPYGYNAPPYAPMGNPYMQQQYPPQYPGYPPQNMPPMNPYGYPAAPVQGMMSPTQEPAENTVLKQAVNVQNVQFPVFSAQTVFSAPLTNGNMDMLMNVPLNVSIEIGRTKKKIKDIMDFNQGSIIELEKQAGAPVDVVVNGQLMARGDVVVIDDNFAVRITEILGTKELISSIESANK